MDHSVQPNRIGARRIVVAKLIAVTMSFSLIVCGADRSQGEEPAEKDEYLPVIATSGDVEVDSIEVQRRRASGQAKSADLINMTVSLRLAVWDQPPERAMLKVTELDPIVDNTGKVLLTERRLKALPFFNKDDRTGAVSFKNGRVGPIIHLLLDAPAREATSIRAIKGRASISSVELSELQFKDLQAINGKLLDDPKLKNFPIKASIQLVDGDTEVSLHVPDDDARVAGWTLMNKARRPPRPLSESLSPDREPDRKVIAKTYAGDQTKGNSLVIMLAEPASTREVEFEFKDIELP